MTREIDLERWSVEAARWGARYRETLGARPVRPDIAPGTVLDELPASPPEEAEEMDAIFADFERIVPGAMTHWQHPRFFAYFQSNTAPAAAVAEQLVAAMGAQCMLWQTSPAATEMEIRMMEWLGQAVGLPMRTDGGRFVGTMQDTASSATLAAVLTMRERATAWRANRSGLAGEKGLRIYASGRTHSSVDKALWIAGLGQDALVKVPTGDGPLFAMNTEALSRMIARDRAAGLVPAGIVACVGGTSIGATDDVGAIMDVAEREGLFVHVDAAWAGAAMICPEFRDMWSGVERADSIVFNPHKWLGTGMECSAHFIADPEAHVRTLAIRPAFLETPGRGPADHAAIDFSEWSVTLGRRFRALKVWFLLRAYGLEGLRARIRDHVRWSAKVAEGLRALPHFRIVTEPVLSLFSFAHERHEAGRLADEINRAGTIYVTQTDHDGEGAVRFVMGTWETREEDVAVAVEAIREAAARLDAHASGPVAA